MKLKQRPLKEEEKQNLFFIYIRDKKNNILFLHPAPNGKDFLIYHTYINAVLATASEAANIIKVINPILGTTHPDGFKTLPFNTVVK